MKLEFKGTRTFEGKWTVCKETLRHGMERITGYGMEEVCLITNKQKEGLMGGTYPDNETQEANAKLIAAAPELLENLTRIIDRIEESNLQGNFPSAYQRAKQALKKAL